MVFILVASTIVDTIIIIIMMYCHCPRAAMQVNHSPSFSTDTPLDLAIKKQLILETLALVRVDPHQLRRGKAADKQLAAERLLKAKGRATEDQPSAVSLDEMQSIRCSANMPKCNCCSLSY